jgi:hypothetical protein
MVPAELAERASLSAQMISMVSEHVLQRLVIQAAALYTR